MKEWKTVLECLMAMGLTLLLATACGDDSNDDDDGNNDTGTGDSAWTGDDTDSPTDNPVDTNDTGNPVDTDNDAGNSVDTEDTSGGQTGGFPPAASNTQWMDDFESLTSIDELWTAKYEALSADDCTPMFVVTAGAENITLANGSVKLYNGRFAIGMVGGAEAAPTSATTSPGGALNIGAGAQVFVEISEAADIEPGDTDAGGNKFFVYLDNNTTSSDNSIWDDAAKIINPPIDEIIAQLEAAGGPVVLSATIPEAVGGLAEGDFLQIRVESGASVVIDSIYITGSPKDKATCASK